MSTRVVCVNGEHPRFYPVLQLWGFCGFEALDPFLCTRFPPGWFVSMVSAPCSTPHFSYDAFAGLKHYTPFYAQDFHPGGLCQWWAAPVLSRTSVMRLLRVWSIIPFLCTRFPPGWLVSMVSAPCSTPYFSYEAFAGLKHYTPFYAQDFHLGGLCQWWALPVLPRTSVMMLLRVWSIIPLFMHKIPTRVVCVNGEQSCLLHSFCLDGSRTSSPSEWSTAAVRWV